MATKQKSPNFSEFEKEVLLELIGTRKNIIENKQNDGRMIIKKNAEWSNIEKEFNSRTVLQCFLQVIGLGCVYGLLHLQYPEFRYHS